MSRFKLLENLVGVGQRKLILNPSKQKLLKVKDMLIKSSCIVAMPNMNLLGIRKLNIMK